MSRLSIFIFAFYCIGQIYAISIINCFNNCENWLCFRRCYQYNYINYNNVSNIKNLVDKNEQSNELKQCIICMESIEPKEWKQCSIKCHADYHLNCWNQCMQLDDKCPHCREIQSNNHIYERYSRRTRNYFNKEIIVFIILLSLAAFVAVVRGFGIVR